MIDRDSLIHILLDYQMLIKDQEKRVIHLANALYLDQNSEIESLINSFAIENEEIYLKLKRLIYDVRPGHNGNRHEAIGTTDAFPSLLEKMDEECYRFHLPPFYSVKPQDRSASNAGKHIFYLIMNLEAEYEDKNEKIMKIDHPVVIYEHHICSNIQRVFDFDNIDSKRALDAMQGYFLEDDNALHLVAVNIAVKDSESSYCDIYIGDRSSKCITKILTEIGKNKN